MTFVEQIDMIRAGQQDVATVAEMLEEAAAWLLMRGIAQWPAGMPRDFIVERVGRGEVYLARRAGAPVGTITLQTEDPQVWGQRPPDALYIHSLAVRRAEAGRRLGEKMLDWAGQVAAVDGRQFVRLDCWAENMRLCAYYEQAGFRRCGQIGTRPGRSYALYERPAAYTL